MMKYIRIIGVIGVLASLLIWALPAFGISDPDSSPTIDEAYGNTYLLESGDVLIYGLLTIPYASIPDEAADDTYNIQLIDTDNTTLLGSYLIYPSLSNGYNEQLFGLYFSAADNLTLDESYIIRISQNPAYFDSPENYDYPMNLTDWTDETAQTDNQAEVYANMINIAGALETAHDETLVESGYAGNVLYEPTGATYFRSSIYGIQAMCPDLFLLQEITLDWTDRVWTTDHFDDYETTFSGTFIGTATDNTSATYGVETETMMGIFYVMPIVVVFIVISQIKFKKAEPGYMVAPIILILGLMMGWFPQALFAFIYQLFAIYIGYLFFFSRSGDTFGTRMVAFLAFVWLMSTAICLITEGAWFGSDEYAVINQVAVWNVYKIAGIIPIPVPGLEFFNGFARMLLWDYSFYSGDFEFLRWVFFITFGAPTAWGIISNFVPVFAQFLRLPRIG